MGKATGSITAIAGRLFVRDENRLEGFVLLKALLQLLNRTLLAHIRTESLRTRSLLARRLCEWRLLQEESRKKAALLRLRIAAFRRSVRRHECCPFAQRKQPLDIERIKPRRCTGPSGIGGRFPVGRTVRSVESSRVGNSPKASEP